MRSPSPDRLAALGRACGVTSPLRRDRLCDAVRLRRLAQAEALRQLAERLNDQTAAEATVGAARTAIGHEPDLAIDCLAADASVEKFAAALPGASATYAQAEALRETAWADTARARAVLAAARSALEAAERVLAIHDATTAKRLRRRELPVAELAPRMPAEKR